MMIMVCFQNANGCSFVRDGVAPSTKSPPSPVSSPPGEDFFGHVPWYPIASFVNSVAGISKNDGSVSPSPGGEGWGEDGRLTNFINDLGADL